MQIHILKCYSIKIVKTVRRTHFLYLCLLTVMISITASQDTVPCKTRNDCHGLCLTCDVGFCVFTYKYRFDKLEYCDLFYRENIKCMGPSSGNRSDIRTCSSPDGGKCDRIEDAFRESCVCKTGYYGDTCQNKTEGLTGMVRSLTVQHVDFVNPVREYKLKIVLIGQTMEDFDGLKEITVTTNEGYYKKMNFKVELNNMCLGYSLCVTFWVTDFKVSFKPYKTTISSEEPGQRYDSDGDQWFSPDLNEIYGVRRNLGLKITVVQNNLTHISADFDMFVNYGAFERVVLNCVPSILKITNCKQSYETALKYKRSSAIAMEHEVIFLENGGFVNQSHEDKTCAKDAKLFWRVDHNFDVEGEDSEPAKEFSTEEMIRFESFTLDYGFYRAYLEWSVIKESVVKNFAYCYFQVIKEPIIAIITGGDDRVMTSDQGLLLSAAESYDPNCRRLDKEQLMLTSQWYCRREPLVEDALCGRWTEAQPVSKPYFIRPGLLKSPAVYNFELYVSSKASHQPQAGYAYIRVQVKPENSTEKTVYIKCVHNCGNIVIPNEIIFIKAEIGNRSYCTDCKWVYYKEDNQAEEKPTDSIMELNLPPHMLIIKEDILEKGIEYSIEARQYSTGAYAKYSFQTAKLVYEGNCTVEPPKGIKGETDFDIVCTQYETLLYEFYDKTPEEASEDIMFNGRMLGSSSDGNLRKVKLSRGTVLIYAVDAYGLFVSKKVQVEISDSKDSNLLKKLLIHLIVSLKTHADISNSLRFMSIIADLTPDTIDKSIILNKVLHVIPETPKNTLQDVKLSISTLAVILVSLNGPMQLVIKTSLMLHIQGLVLEQSNILKNTITRRSRWMSPKEVRQVCKYVLNCLYLAFKSRDMKTEGLNPDDFRLQDLIELKYCSEFMEGTIDNVKYMLSVLQAPGQSPTTVSAANDSLVVWVMSNDDDEMPFNRTLTNYTVIPVEISDGLQKALNKFQRGKQLFLQVMSIKENIFWWSKSDVSSNLLSISIVSQKLTEESLFHVTTLKIPLGMHVNITASKPREKVSGTAVQLDPSLNPLYLDLHIVVHRIDIPPRCVATLTFLLTKTNESLLIFASSDTRPGYNSVKQSGVLITGESPTFTTPFYNNEDPLFLYIGILPGSEVSVNQSVTYAFEVGTKVCQTWRKGVWISDDCRPTENSSRKYAYCQCNHLSVFGVAIPVLETKSSKIDEAYLILTVFDNPHIIGFIFTFLLIYLIICFIVRCRDNLDRKMQEIIVLEDNFPGDTYPYLVAVYTSPRYNAGTTAHVGFKLMGTAASSRAHVFRSSERKVLRQGCDDWFLIFTNTFLERISSLHVWHDNAGKSPTWFCNKIFVYDLTDNEQYQFVVDEWMSLHTNCYPEFMAFPLEEKDAKELTRTFYENVYLGMREIHTILNIMYSHPRSYVTRVQRVSICMCGMMVSLLFSIMYYISDFGEIPVDDDQFALTLKELFITLQNLLIGTIVTSTGLCLFTRAYKSQVTPNERRITHLSLKKSLYSTSAQISLPSSVNNYQRIVTKMFKFPSLAPVHIHNKNRLKTRIEWLILAWFVCVGFLLACSCMVMWLGFNMGPVKSKAWLSTLVFAMAGDFFFISPMRIVIYSFFLSTAFQKMYEVNTYTISLQSIHLIQKQIKENDWQELRAGRCSRTYAPLDFESRSKSANKYNEKLKWWLSIDFLVSASFVVVTSAVVFRLWSSYYYNTYLIIDVITKSVLPYMHSHDFFSVQSIPDLEAYLGNTFIYGMYSTRWYNDDFLDEGVNAIAKYWLIDSKNRMIGRPKIRQLRVQPEVVRNNVMPPILRIPDWSTATEDTYVYSDYWEPGSWRHAVSNESFWTFYEPTIPAVRTLFRLYGASGRLFHNGGYFATLGPDRIDAEYILVDLQSSGWQDERTRVVFAEWTVYNVNYDLFTQVTLMVEFLASKQVLLRALGGSLRSSLNILGWEVAFILYMIYYIVRSFCLANEQGLVGFLRDIKNVLRIIVITLSLLTIFYLGLHIYTSTLYSSTFQKENLDMYFDFDRFAEYFYRMKIVLGFLFVVAIFYALSHMQFGRKFTNTYYVVFTSLTWLFWMFLILYVVIFTLINITYLLDISTAFCAINMITMRQLMGRVHTQISEDSNNSHVKVFFTLVTVLPIWLVMAGFIIQFLNTVRLVKANSLKYSSKYNIALFIVSKLKRRPQTENTT